MFDDGLSGAAVAARGQIQPIEHPLGEIHVHPLLGVSGARGLAQVEVFQDAFAPVKLFIKLLRGYLLFVLNIIPFRRRVPGAR